MAELPIADVSPARARGDGWVSKLFLKEGEEEFELQVTIANTQRVVAQTALTPQWIAERALACAPLLDNYRPVLEQVREWPQPLQLYAKPR
jgi:hypothetical protein